MYYIQQAQRNDPNVNRLPSSNPGRYTILEGIIRVGRDERKKVVIPDAIAWEFVKRVHEYLDHLNANKIIRYIRKYFAVRKTDRAIKSALILCPVCLAKQTNTPIEGSITPKPNRHRRRARARVSLSAYKLNNSNSDTSEIWIQSRNCELDTSSKSNDTWEDICIPRKIRRKVQSLETNKSRRKQPNQPNNNLTDVTETHE